MVSYNIKLLIIYLLIVKNILEQNFCFLRKKKSSCSILSLQEKKLRFNMQSFGRLNFLIFWHFVSFLPLKIFNFFIMRPKTAQYRNLFYYVFSDKSGLGLLSSKESTRVVSYLNVDISLLCKGEKLT